MSLKEKTVDVLGESFEKLKKIAGILYGEEVQARRKLDEAIRRLEDLNTLPLPLDDFIENIRERIAGGAKNDFPQNLKHTLHGMNQKPMADWNNTQFNPLVGFGTEKNHPGALTYCFQEIIEQAIEKAIRSWDDYPRVVGPPRAERKVEIAKLEKDIPKLQDRLEKIIAISKSGGHTDDKYLLKRKGKLIPPPE